MKLGSGDAKTGLANLYMYGWGSNLYKKDYDRAEELLLSVLDFNSSGMLHQVYYLYSMKNDDKNAFILKMRDADTYGDNYSVNYLLMRIVMERALE